MRIEFGATCYPKAKKFQGISPNGWHISTDKEWKRLEKAFGIADKQCQEVSINWQVPHIKKLVAAEDWLSSDLNKQYQIFINEIV